MDFNNMFNGMFGKVGAGMCRLTMNGNIAVKTSGGYKTYNVSKGTLTNVSSFCFDIGEEFFFVIPTNKVAVGDIILVDRKPKCVIAVDKKIITAIDYESSEVRQIVPERHVFMGATYFYGKIVSMFGSGKALKSSDGIGRVMKMMMLSQMMGGNKTDGMGNMGQMMMMSQMMGGGNMFEGMFDFDFGDSEEPVEETEEEEDE